MDEQSQQHNTFSSALRMIYICIKVVVSVSVETFCGPIASWKLILRRLLGTKCSMPTAYCTVVPVFLQLHSNGSCICWHLTACSKTLASCFISPVVTKDHRSRHFITQAGTLNVVNMQQNLTKQLVINIDSLSSQCHVLLASNLYKTQPFDSVRLLPLSLSM